MNQVSFFRLCWKLLTFEEKWAVLGRTKFFRKGNPINRHITWSIGNGENVHFWTDRWLARPIVDSWHIPEKLHSSLDKKDGRWFVEHF